MASAGVVVSAHADARTLLTRYWDPRRGAITVAALGVVVRFWLLGSGWFHDSDHVLRIRGWELPFTQDYLLQAPVPGITPGLAALQWPLSRAWPMNFTPQALILIGLQCLVVLLATRLMLRLWPGSWWTLVPVTIVAFSPLTLPQAAWWTSGVPTSLTQISLLLLLLAGTTWWRRGSTVPLVLATIVWILVCPFGDLALVVPVLAVAVLPVLDPGAVRRSRRAVTILAAAATALVAAAVVARILLVPTTYPGRPQAEDWANAVGRAVSDGLGALVGGPLTWAPLAPETPATNPPLWWTIAALQVVLVLVVTSSALSRRALVLWVWAFTWLLLTVGLALLASPVPSTTAFSIQTMRVTAAAGLPLALALGMALHVLRGPARRGLAHLRGVRVPTLASPALAVAAVCGVVVASLVSLSGYRTVWSANDGRGYVAGATYSLATAAEGPALLDQAVPPAVLSPLSSPYQLVRRFLAPLEPRPDIADVTTQLRVLAADGSLRQGIVQGVASAKGPVPGCGWLLRDSGSVPLATPVPDFAHTIRMTYFASGDGTATVSFGDAPGVVVPISRGLGEVDLNLAGGGDAVRIASITSGVSVCTDDITVGVPVIAP